MNGSLIDDLPGQPQGARAVPNAIAAALPMVAGALGRNVQQSGDADRWPG